MWFHFIFPLIGLILVGTGWYYDELSLILMGLMIGSVLVAIGWTSERIFEIVMGRPPTSQETSKILKSLFSKEPMN
jgi:hypothetical protein